MKIVLMLILASATFMGCKSSTTNLGSLDKDEIVATARRETKANTPEAAPRIIACEPQWQGCGKYHDGHSCTNCVQRRVFVFVNTTTNSVTPYSQGPGLSIHYPHIEYRKDDKWQRFHIPLSIQPGAKGPRLRSLSDRFAVLDPNDCFAFIVEDTLSLRQTTWRLKVPYWFPQDGFVEFSGLAVSEAIKPRVQSPEPDKK